MKLLNKQGGTMRVLLLFGLILTLCSCNSGWNQDPFAEDPDDIQNAVPQGTEKKGEPPVAGVIFIDAAPSYNVKEGSLITIPVSYRITNREFVNHRIEVENLEQTLPGATYDPQLGVIEFEVPEDAVPAGSLILQRLLTFSVYADYKGLTKVFKKTISVNIIRGLADVPTIEKVENFATELREDNKARFQVYVRDQASLQGPRMSIVSSGQGYKDAAPFIDLETKGKAVSGDPGLWVFKGLIDLPYNGIDITSSKVQITASMIAYSEYGVPSTLKKSSLDVYTTATTPKFFMGQRRIEFKKGIENTFVFAVTDTKNEGKIAVDVNSCNQLVGSVGSCQCREFTGEASCTIKWTPETSGRRSIRFSASNTVNRGSSFEQTKRNQETLTINVVE